MHPVLLLIVFSVIMFVVPIGSVFVLKKYVFEGERILILTYCSAVGGLLPIHKQRGGT